MDIEEYVLKNDCLEVHVLNLGGTVRSIFTRDCRWQWTDVVLGLEEAGRYAGGEGPMVTGEAPGWWQGEQEDGEHLVLRPAEGEGDAFTGEGATIRYSLEGHVLHVEEEWRGRSPRGGRLAAGMYFNLHPAEETVGGHELRLYSRRCAGLSAARVPTGGFTEADRRHSFGFNKPLSLALEEGGIRACYAYEDPIEPQLMAELASPKNGIDLTVLSDYAGLVVDTGEGLDAEGGKGGRHYGAAAGIALVPRELPGMEGGAVATADAGQGGAEGTVATGQPGGVCRHRTLYVFNCFSVEEDTFF